MNPHNPKSGGGGGGGGGGRGDAHLARYDAHLARNLGGVGTATPPSPEA